MAETTTNKSERDIQWEKFRDMMEPYLAQCREANARALIVSVTPPGAEPIMAMFMAGDNRALCLMIVTILEKVQPEDFAVLLEMMQTSPRFYLHRNPPKEGMVN